MRLTGHVARKREGSGEMHTEFWWRKPKKRGHSEDQGVNVSTILRRIFRKWDEGSWIGLIWVRIGTVGGLP